MGGDAGLSSAPWIHVEVYADAVQVDGVPIQADGSAEGRYLAAIQQIATEVAGPLGRRVGVTVTDSRGEVRSHLAVHPDGTVDSIEELVRAAAGPAVTVPAARESGVAPRESVERSRRPIAVRTPRVIVGSRRRLVAVVATIAAGAAAVVAAPLFNSGRGDEASSTSGTPDLVDTTPVSVSAPAAPIAETVVPTVMPAPALRRLVVLTPVAGSSEPCQLVLTIAPAARPLRAELRVRAADGAVVVRRFALGPDSSRSVVLDGLAPGRATWTLRAVGARRASGALTVMAVPVVTAPPAAPPPAPPATPPPPKGGGKGGGGGGGGGSPQADPVIPIDPDDL